MSPECITTTPGSIDPHRRISLFGTTVGRFYFVRNRIRHGCHRYFFPYFRQLRRVEVFGKRVNFLLPASTRRETTFFLNIAQSFFFFFYTCRQIRYDVFFFVRYATCSVVRFSANYWPGKFLSNRFFFFFTVSPRRHTSRIHMCSLTLFSNARTCQSYKNKFYKVLMITLLF